MSDVLMSLRELAESAGEGIGTIVFYERLGLIRAAVEGSARRYDQDARLRLEIIRKGRRLGFSLREIGALIASRTAGRQPAEITPPSKHRDWGGAGFN